MYGCESSSIAPPLQTVQALPADPESRLGHCAGPLRQLLRDRLQKVDSDHRRIALGAVSAAGFVAIAKLAGAAKEVALAWRFGVSEAVDAYQFASTLVFWLPSMFVSVVTVVLVPMLVRLRREDAHVRAEFLRELTGSALLAGLLLGALVLGPGRAALPHLIDELSPATRDMTDRLMGALALLVPLTLLIAIGAARLLARERQVGSVLEGVPAAVLLLFVLLWAPYDLIAPLIWGTVLGIVVHAAWVWRFAAKTEGALGPIRFTWHSRHWPEFRRSIGVLAIGQLAMSFLTPLDQYMAGQLGDGAIATLGYANRVIALLLGIGAVAIARSTLPVMSDLQAAGQGSRGREVALKWAALMLLAGALAAALGWALAPWGIGRLFERGAFDAENTRMVAEIFRWGVIQVPFYFAALVLVQYLASLGRYGTIAAFATSNLAVKAGLNWVLSAWIGLAGIALATSLMTCWSAACLYWAARRTRPSQ